MGSNALPPSKSIAPVDVDNGNVPGVTPSNDRIGLCPNQDHSAQNDDDHDAEFSPVIFRSMEWYLPLNLLDASRDTKLKFMRERLCRYSNVEERKRVQMLTEYRRKLNYTPVCTDLRTLNPSMVFLPSILNALSAMKNGEIESIRSIIKESAPGIYTFEMLRPYFRQMLLFEVAHIENRIRTTRSSILLPSTVNKFSIGLVDFGMKDILDMFLEHFIKHVCPVLFPDVGGDSLDSHHGYVVQYGTDKEDVKEDFHVDDSEVTLNICLGKEFTGGQLFFECQQCEKHVNTKIHPEKTIEIDNSVGCATLYRGCHRHGARATTSGCRINLLMWCRSSVFREVEKHDKGFKDFCKECQTEKNTRRLEMLAAMRKALLGDAALESS